MQTMTTEMQALNRQQDPLIMIIANKRNKEDVFFLLLKNRKYTFVFCYIFLFFPSLLFSQSFVKTNDFSFKNEKFELEFSKAYVKRANDKYKIGKIEFDNIYTDNISNYISRIDTISERNDSYLIRMKVNKEDVDLRIWKKNFISEDSTVLGIESLIPPYKRTTVISSKKISTTSIENLKDSLQQAPSIYPYLILASQDCSSYAFECIFKCNNINTEPIFSRNSTIKSFEDAYALCELFLKEEEIIKRKNSKKIKSIPDKSIIAFSDNENKYIHFLFHKDDVFYSKNGISCYVYCNDINCFFKSYKAEKIVIYTLDFCKLKNYCL